MTCLFNCGIFLASKLIVMEKERTLEMLSNLTALQAEAMVNGVHAFEINARHWKADPDAGDEPDELGITGHIFLRGDDTEEDYMALGFYESQPQADWVRTYNNIKAFISCFC